MLGQNELLGADCRPIDHLKPLFRLGQVHGHKVLARPVVQLDHPARLEGLNHELAAKKRAVFTHKPMRRSAVVISRPLSRQDLLVCLLGWNWLHCTTPIRYDIRHVWHFIPSAKDLFVEIAESSD